MKKTTTLWLIPILCLLVLCSCGKSPEEQWQEQYDLGVRYLSEGNYEEAIIAFTAAIEIDPNRVEAYVGRGDAYMASGEMEENLTAALADYEAALELDENSVNAWLGLVHIYQIRGETERATSVAEEGYSHTYDDRLLIGDDPLETPVSDSEEEIPEGLLIRENWYDTGVGGLWNYTVYNYNSDGDCIEEITTTADGDLQSHIRYDSRGNVTYNYDYWDREDAGIEYINTYDTAGQLVRQQTVNGDSWTEYQYNEDGQLVRSIGSSEETEYYYNENGLLAQVVSSVVVDSYEYDEFGNLASRMRKWREDINQDYAGTIISYQFYTYDEAGRLLSTYSPAMAEGVWKPEHHDEDNRFEYVYTLDEAGNVIRQDIYHNGAYEGWREYIYS